MQITAIVNTTILTGAHSIPQPSAVPVKNLPIRSSALKPTEFLQMLAPANVSQPIKLRIAENINADFLPTKSTANPAPAPPTMAPISARDYRM